MTDKEDQDSITGNNPEVHHQGRTLPSLETTVEDQTDSYLPGHSPDGRHEKSQGIQLQGLVQEEYILVINTKDSLRGNSVQNNPQEHELQDFPEINDPSIYFLRNSPPSDKGYFHSNYLPCSENVEARAQDPVGARLTVARIPFELSERKLFFQKVFAVLTFQYLVIAATIAVFMFYVPVKPAVNVYEEDSEPAVNVHEDDSEPAVNVHEDDSEPAVNVHEDDSEPPLVELETLLLIVGLLVLLLTIVLIFCDSLRRKAYWNILFLNLFTSAVAMLLAVVSSLTDELAMLIVAGITAAVCLTLSLVASFTNLTTAKGVLLCFVIVSVIAGLLTFAIPEDNLITHVLSSVVALVLSVYLTYNSQRIVAGNHPYNISPDEYIFAVLNLYQDICLTLINLLIQQLKGVLFLPCSCEIRRRKVRSDHRS